MSQRENGCESSGVILTIIRSASIGRGVWFAFQQRWDRGLGGQSDPWGSTCACGRSALAGGLNFFRIPKFSFRSRSLWDSDAMVKSNYAEEPFCLKSLSYLPLIEQGWSKDPKIKIFRLWSNWMIFGHKYPPQKERNFSCPLTSKSTLLLSVL